MGEVKRKEPREPAEAFKPLLSEVAFSYVNLEREIRKAIDRVVGPVCSVCTRVCCRASYCRRTWKNPWYRYLFENFCDSKGIVWERSDPPPGLGPKGCEIRVGRYAYCYAYNCRRIMEVLKTREEKSRFQELSDLMKDLGLHFAGKRHLSEIESWREITPPRLEALRKKIEEGRKRFLELRALLSINEPENPPD